MSSAIVWFRVDLRLMDNPALQAALDHRGTVAPVFIHAPEEEAPWQPGAASRWWLHQSLSALESRLRGMGSRLVIRRGPVLQTLRALIKDTRSDAVFFVLLSPNQPAAVATERVFVVFRVRRISLPFTRNRAKYVSDGT